MIKGFCFISDDRYHRMGQWCKNSFEATNLYKLELAFSNPKVRRYITSITKDDSIWN